MKEFESNERSYSYTLAGRRLYLGLGNKKLYKKLKSKQGKTFYIYKCGSVTFITPDKSFKPILALYEKHPVMKKVIIGEKELGHEIPYTEWLRLAKEYLGVSVKRQSFKIKIPSSATSFIVAGASYAGKRTRFKKVKCGSSGKCRATLVSENFRNPLYSGQNVQVWNVKNHTVNFKIDTNQKLLFIKNRQISFIDNRDLWRKVAEVTIVV